MTIYRHYKKLCILLPFALLLVLTACSSLVPVSNLQQQPTSQVSPSFQKQVSPVPTQSPYICGSWASNNAPGTYSTIQIYARLMHDLQPVNGAAASATVHFQYSDLTLDQHPASDNGGYVTFSLSLAGREPHGVPATVDVSFSVNNKTVNCSAAFFTPQ